MIKREGGPYPGVLTFNAEIADDYDGHIFILATVRIEDHAHIDTYTGWQSAAKYDRLPTRHYGHAGRLIFAWADWLRFREALDVVPNILIREVERPTQGQLDTHAG